MARKQTASVATMALLIAGNAVGAGILGVPVSTGLAGMLPAALGMAAVWAMMLATGWIMASSLLREGAPDEDIPTLFRRELGGWGKWLSVTGYLVNYYGVMTAYLAGAASVLSSLLGAPQARDMLLLAFFIPATGLALFGLDAVRKGNALLMVLLAASFLALLMLAGRGMQAQRLEYMDWPFLPAALPIIMCSLAYHCMIPATCRSLGGRPRLVWKALFWGVTITTAFNLLWIAVVSGALPLAGPTGLAEALRLNQPATVPLAAALHSPAVTLAGLFFSICAILTSYLGVGVALTGFMKDLVGPLLPRKDRLPLALIVYGPPLAVVYIYPDLFLKVLDIIGGLGLGLVFGVCPALMLLKNGVGFGSRRRLWGLLLLGFFAVLMALEAAQELGWLHIAPGVEYWKLGGRAG